MPMRQRLKRRFGKDNERPIYSKPGDDEFRKKYDQIDWNKNSKEANDEGTSDSTRSQHESSQA